MINMQMSKEEANEEYGTPKEADMPKYPYGLCLYLDDDALAKLGYTDPPPVGTVLNLTASVTVTSTGINQTQGGDKESRCEMQITDMELGAATRPDTASVLYGS